MSELLDLAKQVIKASNCKPFKIGEFLSWNYGQVKKSLEINQQSEEDKLQLAFEYGMVSSLVLNAIHTICPELEGNERSMEVYPIDIDDENISEESAEEFAELADYEACEDVFNYELNANDQLYRYRKPIQKYDIKVSDEIIRVEYSDAGSHLTEGSIYYLIPKDVIEG